MVARGDLGVEMGYAATCRVCRRRIIRDMHA